MAGKRDPFKGKSYAERIATDTREEQPGKVDNRPAVKAYRIGAEVDERIGQVAEDWNVYKQDLVRVLLEYALGALERGELKLDIEERPRRLR